MESAPQLKHTPPLALAGLSLFSYVPYPLDDQFNKIQPNQLVQFSETHQFELPRCFHGVICQVMPWNGRNYLKCPYVGGYDCGYIVDLDGLVGSDALTCLQYPKRNEEMATNDASCASIMGDPSPYEEQHIPSTYKPQSPLKIKIDLRNTGLKSTEVGNSDGMAGLRPLNAAEAGNPPSWSPEDQFPPRPGHVTSEKRPNSDCESVEGALHTNKRVRFDSEAFSAGSTWNNTAMLPDAVYRRSQKETGQVFHTMVVNEVDGDLGISVSNDALPGNDENAEGDDLDLDGDWIPDDTDDDGVFVAVVWSASSGSGGNGDDSGDNRDEGNGKASTEEDKDEEEEEDEEDVEDASSDGTATTEEYQNVCSDMDETDDSNDSEASSSLGSFIVADDSQESSFEYDSDSYSESSWSSITSNEIILNFGRALGTGNARPGEFDSYSPTLRNHITSYRQQFFGDVYPSGF